MNLFTSYIVNAVAPNALRLAPPLVITAQDVDQAVSILAIGIFFHTDLRLFFFLIPANKLPDQFLMFFIIIH